jgi:transcriptional regulator with XRE-family HTH domain
VVFGKVLQALRASRGRRNSLEAVSQDLAAIGVRVAKSTLSRYEDGRVPDIATIDGLARLLKISRDRLVDVLVQEVSGRPMGEAAQIASDLLSHTLGLQTLLLSKEGGDVVLSTAEARLLAQRNAELEQYAHDLNDTLNEVAAAAERLASLARFDGRRREAGLSSQAPAIDGTDD